MQAFFTMTFRKRLSSTPTRSTCGVGTHYCKLWLMPPRRDSEDRHLRRGHQIRLDDDDWYPAKRRAETVYALGMRELIEGWIRAFNAGQLAPHVSDPTSSPPSPPPSPPSGASPSGPASG